MVLNFEQYAAKGNELLALLSNELGLPRDQSARILRSVLHTLRHHLSVQESLQVISQLPMMLKAVYVDRWNPSKEPRRIKHLEEFLDELREEDRKSADNDLGYDIEAAMLVRGVFRVLSQYLSAGEFEDMVAVFPKEIKSFILSGIERRMPL